MSINSKGKTHSEESKEKMREAKKKNPPTHRKGVTLSDKHKKDISESMRNRPKEIREQAATKMFKKIEIYNEDNILVKTFNSIKDFKAYGKQEGWPTTKLRDSSISNEPIIYMQKKKMKKFIGWYGVRV